MSHDGHDQRWWKAPKNRLADLLSAEADRLDSEQGIRRAQLQHYLRLYGDKAMGGYATANSTAGPHRGWIGHQKDFSRLSLNVVRNMVDAATSKIAKSRPRAQNQTTAGDYSLKRIAKQRDRLLDGLLHSGDFWELRTRAIKNAALLGTGVVAVLPWYGQCKYEYVFPGELLVDDYDGMEGKPRRVIRTRIYDRDVLRTKYPGAARAIDAAAPPNDTHFGRRRNADQVLAYQAWSLPEKPGGVGKYVGVCGDAVLFDEDWKHDSFPFGVWRWSEEPLGFWGKGLGEQLSGIQLEINQLLHLIQESIYKGGNFKIFVERGSMVVDAHLNNLVGSIIEYNGTPPKFFANDVVSPQLFQHLQYLVGQAYEITGISQLSAAGAMPAGLAGGSGRAQLVYHNIESERLTTVHRNDEAACVDIAQQTLNCARDLAESEEGYTVRYSGRNWIEEIDVATALEDVGPFEITMLPASQLPHDYAGRVALLENMEARGLISRAQVMEHLDYPDPDKLMALDLAPANLVESQVEMILEEGRNVTPVPYMDLAYAIDFGSRAFTKAYNDAVRQENDELMANVDLLGQWIEQCKQLAAPPPQPSASPAMPGAPLPEDVAAEAPLPMPGEPMPGMPPGVPPMPPADGGGGVLQ